MCVGFLSNLYFGFTVEEYMFKSMELIVEIGMGVVLLDPLTKRFGKSEDQPLIASGNTQTQATSGTTQTTTSATTQTATTGATETTSNSIDMPTGADPIE